MNSSDANKSAVTRSSFELRSLNVADFAEGNNPLSGLDDPHGYLRTHDHEGIKLLRSNPFAQDSDLALVIIVDNGKVVGRLAFYAGPSPSWARDRRLLWLSGFFLDTAYRETGAGGMLLLRALANKSDLIGAGAPSKDLEAVYDKIGFTRLGPLHRWVHFYNARVIVGKFIRARWIQRTAGAVAWPLLRAYQLIRRPVLNSAGLSFRPETKMPGELDSLVAQSDSKEPFRRGGSVWNWILPFEAGLIPFTIWRNEDLYGYCILRQHVSLGGGSHGLPPMRIGELVDYHVPDGTAVAEVLEFAREHFRLADCDVFEVQCRHPAMESFCKQSAMIQLGGYRIFYRTKHDSSPLKERDWNFTSAVADMTLSSVLQDIQE